MEENKLEDIKTIKKTVGKIIEWLPKIYEIFQPFRPETKAFEINYKSKTAKIKYSLQIPVDLRRKIGRNIELPKFENFQIESIIDEGFNELKRDIVIRENSGSLTIKTKQLPKCENFFITLNGEINPQFIYNLVKIKPAINRDSTATYDKYWLDVMIKDVTILEKIYNSLDINDISCIVKVSIEKFFTIDIPKPLLDAVKIFKEFILAGKGIDRNLLFRKWTKFRISSRKWEVSDLQKMYEDLISKIFVEDCIVLDEPFYLGEIKNPYTSKVIPSHFTAEALANLTLDNPAANGYLKFQKKRYKEKIKDEIFGDWDKFKVSKKNQKRFRE